jgi:hypothetical protein
VINARCQRDDVHPGYLVYFAETGGMIPPRISHISDSENHARYQPVTAKKNFVVMAGRQGVIAPPILWPLLCEDVLCKLGNKLSSLRIAQPTLQLTLAIREVA